MASPFSIFRKNQKLMLALLTLLAMFGFVFLPAILEGMGGRSIQNPVVVHTTQFGDLKEHDLQTLVQQKRKVLGALSFVLQSVGVPANMAQQWLESRLGSGSEESVANAWLLSQVAQQQGIIVSDDMVNGYLKGLTQNRVKPDRFLAAFRQAGLTEMQFFSAMRDDLAALQLESMFHYSLSGLTPAQRWDYFLRFKQTATIEAVALPVADFTAKIKTPTETELKEFFEKYKDQYPIPGSAEPGFREPKKVALQWFKAESDKFNAAVTDKEIQERYEKNKDLYTEKKEADASVAPVDKPADQSPSTDKAAPTKKPAASPKDSSPNKDKAKSKAPQGTSSSRPSSSPFRLTAMLQEKKPAKPSTTDEQKPLPPKRSLAQATKDRIRREIAFERIQKVFAGLHEQMTQYSTEWNKYRAASIQAQGKDGKSDASLLPTPPAKLDFEKLAKAHGLSAGQTGLISQWEAQSAEIGASLVGGREPIAGYAFQSQAKLRPEESMDLGGNLFLFWITDEAKERVPKFSDPGMKETVLREWKMVKARPLALQSAEKLAAEANKAKKSLKQAFSDQPDLRVLTPPAFSWMTSGAVAFGSAPGAARISEVSGVSMPGDAFMRVVFHLTPEQSGAAMNAPQSTAYVVRLVELAPSQRVLWEQFTVDDFGKYAPAAQTGQRQILQAWMNELKSSAGFEWKRKPDQQQESGSHNDD
ncbi:MAG: SurA N-terminal domain-containing protein [Thermoguttaceae bacterium]